MTSSWPRPLSSTWLHRSTTTTSIGRASPHQEVACHQAPWQRRSRSPLEASTSSRISSGRRSYSPCVSGNDTRPDSRGFKKLLEFGSSSLQGYESSQTTWFIVFRYNQRGADDPWPISADFSTFRSLSFLDMRPNQQLHPHHPNE